MGISVESSEVNSSLRSLAAVTCCLTSESNQFPTSLLLTQVKQQWDRSAVENSLQCSEELGRILESLASTKKTVQQFPDALVPQTQDLLVSQSMVGEANSALIILNRKYLIIGQEMIMKWATNCAKYIPSSAAILIQITVNV